MIGTSLQDVNTLIAPDERNDAVMPPQNTVLSFVGNDIADAVSQARSSLGPKALVVDMHRLPAQGISRLWRRGQVMLRATLPGEPLLDVVAGDAAAGEPRTGLSRDETRIVSTNRTGVERSVTDLDTLSAVRSATPEEARPIPDARPPTGGRAFLEKIGLLPGLAERVAQQIPALRARESGLALPVELDCLRRALLACWRPAARPKTTGIHVFVGPPGSGKSTALCKWLAQAVLLEGRRARVWRLDSRTANTAESLSVMCEVLGVPVARHWPDRLPGAEELWFIDFPGTPHRDAAALLEMQGFLRDLPETPEVHLVLNAAYEAPLLLAQARAFARLPVKGVIATHLDEELLWGKLWNLVVGTDYSISFLSTGQNIPGGFELAAPERLLPRFFSAS